MHIYIGTVLRTAGLQEEMKKEKPLSKEEIIFEFICELTQHVGEKQGYFGPKELPKWGVSMPLKAGKQYF